MLAFLSNYKLRGLNFDLAVLLNFPHHLKSWPGICYADSLSKMPKIAAVVRSPAAGNPQGSQCQRSASTRTTAGACWHPCAWPAALQGGCSCSSLGSQPHSSCCTEAAVVQLLPISFFSRWDNFVVVPWILQKEDFYFFIIPALFFFHNKWFLSQQLLFVQKVFRLFFLPSLQLHNSLLCCV